MGRALKDEPKKKKKKKKLHKGYLFLESTNNKMKCTGGTDDKSTTIEIF